MSRKTKGILARIIFFMIVLAFGLTIMGIVTNAKMVKEYLGEWYVTTYHVSDNTPAGTRDTSSGARATEWYTAAVDTHNPLVPMGTMLEVGDYGVFQVQDCGGFGRYNNGRRALDLFVPENVGFCKPLKIWKLRQETPEEKEERLKKQREKLQESKFILVFDPALAPWQVRTHKDAISGGVIRIRDNFTWMDVVETTSESKNVIYTGSRSLPMLHPIVELDEVCEEAVG